MPRKSPVSVCLDAYAILCWMQDEPGADEVERHLAAGVQDEASRCAISVVNLGEVYYRIGRSRGLGEAEDFWSDVHAGLLPFQVVEVTRNRVRRAAALKARYAIAYADAFAIQLALERGLPLLTGDPEMKVVERREPLEILWLGPDSG